MILVIFPYSAVSNESKRKLFPTLFSPIKLTKIASGFVMSSAKYSSKFGFIDNLCVFRFKARTFKHLPTCDGEVERLVRNKLLLIFLFGIGPTWRDSSSKKATL